jgi:hypothetical protein
MTGPIKAEPGRSASPSGGLEIGYRLPLDGWPRAVFVGPFGYRGGRLLIDGETVLEAASRDELATGVAGAWGAGGPRIALRLVERTGAAELAVEAGGRWAVREDAVRARPARAAWIHAFIALGGSAAGFLASYGYLVKAEALHDEWALKMGQHTAGWHLLLTLTLFPASVWGQRIGIRAVQMVSVVFFFIHAGMALANSDLGDPWIAFFNAASGALFFASVLYGNRAYRAMDPVAALREGRTWAGDGSGGRRG